MTTKGKNRRVTFRIARRGLDLASVRYRGLIPAVAMQLSGWQVELVSGKDQCAETDLAFAVKPLLQADANWAREQVRQGVPVIVDLCDNVFVPGYGGKDPGIADRFRQTVSLASAVTVPTTALANLLHRCFPDNLPPVFVVPDIVETSAILKKERALVGVSTGILETAMKSLKSGISRVSRISVARTISSKVKKIIWFGNHGASYASFGITDIEIFEDALRAISEEFLIELWVVSNSREKFNSVVVPLGVPCRYFEWDEERVDTLLPFADVCIVPNSLDEFSRVKSANRALKALAIGVPVVATPTSAYENLGGALWLGDPLEGLRRYLSRPELVAADLAHARESISKNFSLYSVGLAMNKIADQIGARGLTP